MAYRRGFCDAMLQYDGQASDTEAALNDVLEEDELQIALEQLGQHLPMDAAEHDPQSRDFAVGAPVHHNAPAGESAAVTMSPAPGSSPTIAAQQLDGAATWTTSGPVGGPDARPEPISPSTVGPHFEAFADTLGARALIGATPMILGNDDYSGQLLDHLDSKSIQSEVGFPDMDTFAVTIFGEATRAGSPRRPRRSHRRSPDNDAVGGPEPIHFDVASDLEDMLELSPVPDEVGPFEMDEARWLNPAQPQVAGTTVPLQSWIGLPDFPCGAARGHMPDDLRAMSCSDPWAAAHGAMAPRPPAQPAPAMARPALGKPRHSSPQPSKTLAAHWQGRSPEFGRRSGDESLALSVSLQSWINLPGFSCIAARDEAPPAVQPMPLAAAPARPTLGDRPIVAPVPSLRMPPQAPPLSDWLSAAGDSPRLDRAEASGRADVRGEPTHHKEARPGCSPCPPRPVFWRPPPVRDRPVMRRLGAVEGGKAMVQNVEERSQAVVDARDATLKEILEDPEGKRAELRPFIANVGELGTKPLMSAPRYLHTQGGLLADFAQLMKYDRIDFRAIERAFTSVRWPPLIQTAVVDKERSLDTQKQRFMEKLEQEKADYKLDVQRYHDDLEWLLSLSDYSLAENCETTEQFLVLDGDANSENQRLIHEMGILEAVVSVIKCLGEPSDGTGTHHSDPD